MAVKYPIVNNGNWSNPSIWNDGTVPTSDDIVYANNKTTTIDVNTISVKEIRNDSSIGIYAGGYFTFPTTCTAVNFTGDVYSYTSTVLYIDCRNNYDTITINGDSENIGTSVLYPIQCTTMIGTTITINGDLHSSINISSYNDTGGITININGNLTIPSDYRLFNTIRTNFYIRNGMWVNISGNLYYTGKGISDFMTNQLQCPIFIKVNGDIYYYDYMKTRNPYFSNNSYVGESGPARIECYAVHLSEGVELPNAYNVYQEIYKIVDGIENRYVVYPHSFNYPSSNNVLGGVIYGKDNEYVGTASAVNFTDEQLQRIANCATVSTVQKCFEDFKE